MLLNESLINQGNTAEIRQQRIPSWNNAGRPAKAKSGTLGFNSEAGHLEYWTGNVWLKLPMKKIK